MHYRKSQHHEANDDDKTLNYALNAKIAEESLLLEKQMAYFEEKIRQSKERAWELEKKRSKSCQRAVEKLPPGHYILSACMHA